MIDPRNPYGRGHQQMNKAREQMLIDRYTVAMVELKMAGAGEHTINRYRTITPEMMKKLLPDIRAEIKRYEAGTTFEQAYERMMVTGQLVARNGVFFNEITIWKQP